MSWLLGGIAIDRLSLSSGVAVGLGGASRSARAALPSFTSCKRDLLLIQQHVVVYDEEAAALANGRTAEFLRVHLP